MRKEILTGMAIVLVSVAIGIVISYHMAIGLGLGFFVSLFTLYYKYEKV